MDRFERLVDDFRERRPQAMSPRERRIVAGFGAGYVVAAAAVVAFLPWNRSFDPLVAALLVISFAVITRVEFEVGSVMAVPTPLALVPMLFLAPLPLVPVLAPLAYVLADLPEFIQRKKHLDRWIYFFVDAWFVIGPVVVVGLLADGPPSVSHWPAYAVAFSAQLLTDAGPASLRERLVRGLSVSETLTAAFWWGRIDAVLWPIGLMTAIAAYHHPIAIALVFPLLWLLRTFSRERKERYSAALELNRAYRGTVMLLSDVVEADDNYTADHSRGVVELVNAVADELEIDDSSRQELEFVALLHDVGKIVIPKDILNKPGALSDDEFELMKTHTIEGQILLDRVGGLLGRVGAIVRSCHERWDGRGYPDGLAGFEIPLPARIVFACDAYNAMTTDRPYRAAMSQETALEELWANAGTQFDPRIVSGLTQVIRRGDVRDERETAHAVRSLLVAQRLPEGARLPRLGASNSD